jgi:ATP-dependent DNA ligase
MKREVERHRDRPYRSGRSADWIKVKNPEPRGEPDHGWRAAEDGYAVV